MTHHSFKSRFLPFHRLIFSIAYAILENQSDAEDITQEVYAKLWQQRATLDAIDNDKAYVTTITKNMSLDCFRKKAQRRVAGIDELQERIADCADDAQLFEQREALQITVKAMKHLPATQQKVIRLRHFVGLTTEEIAERIGLSEMNVRQLLSRGRKTLKEKLNAL